MQNVAGAEGGRRGTKAITAPAKTVAAGAFCCVAPRASAIA